MRQEHIASEMLFVPFSMVDADVMLAGGTEGAVCPIGIAGFASLTALSTSEDPLRASIPFDKDRGGL